MYVSKLVINTAFYHYNFINYVLENHIDDYISRSNL